MLSIIGDIDALYDAFKFPIVGQKIFNTAVCEQIAPVNLIRDCCVCVKEGEQERRRKGATAPISDESAS